MTARSANDVTLWDHSYMTASIMKALFGYYLLCSYIVEENEKNNEKDDKKEIEHFDECKKFVSIVGTITSDFKKLIREYKPFSIFSVGWDFFDFIKQSHKIPDVVGRIKILEVIKEKIRETIEREYALGNSIYEDDFGIYFLIPSILSESDLEEVKKDLFKVFNEATKGVLLPVFHIEKWEQDSEFRIGKLLTKAMETLKGKTTSHKIDSIEIPAWVDEWKNGENVALPKDRLICNVCGKGYYCKGEDEKICKTCKNIRKKGRERESPQTVFIDEISWNPERKRYENVCLLIAKFDLDEWLNGKYVRNLFIRDPEKYYDDLSWRDGKVLPGLSKVLGKALGSKIKMNQWNDEAKGNICKEVGSFLSNKIVIAKGKFREDVIQKVIEVIDQEINAGKTLSEIIKKEGKDYFITKSCFSFKYLDDPRILKPPSPSRLMRVWNDTETFFNIITKKIEEKAPNVEACNIVVNEFTLKGKKLVEGLAYIVKIPKLRISGEVICEENCENPTYLRVITPHLSKYLENNKGKVIGEGIEIYHPERRDLVAIATIGDVAPVETNKAYRIISISPTLFMAIIPAQSSLELAKTIKEEYTKHFGKVFGKLPLHIGLIYFKRKMPIFAVLDTANRMLDEFEGEFKSDSDNYAKLRVVSEPADETGCKVLEVTPVEEYESFKYRVKIPYKLGDGNPDYYHPYLVVESNSNDTIELKVDGDTVLQKHVSKIRKEDVLKVRKSLFDFELLDSNIRRFDVGRERKHWLFTSSTSKPKPYLLWDIDNFERLRELIIEKLELTTTQIMNLYEMMMDKIEEWDLKDVEKLKKDATFEKFVNNAIRSIPLRLKVVDSGKSEKDRITREDYELLKATIMNGMFFDFVDLWHTVLKEKFEKKEGGEENV